LSILNYIKQILTELKGVIDINIMIVRDFNIPFWISDFVNKEINKKTADWVEQIDLTWRQNFILTEAGYTFLDTH
jgi:hypothetical protein